MYDDNFEVEMILKAAEKIRFELRHPYVGTEHLLLALLKKDEKVQDLFREYHVSYQSFCDELIKLVGQASKPQELNLYTPMLKRVLEHTIENSSFVNGVSILLSLLEEGDGLALEVLYSLGVDLDIIYEQVKILSKKHHNKSKALEIYKVGHLMNDCVDFDKVVYGREDELLQLEEILLRKEKNNPLLVGAAGVGKTAIVEELVRRIQSKRVPFELEDVKIINLEMGSLVSGTKYRGEFEERLQKMIQEIKDEKNLVLFIDEIHSMVHAGGAEGAICASDILKPYLARGELRVIGATTTREYHQYFEQDEALNRRFDKVVIHEPTMSEMKDILHAVVPSFEKHYKISITEKNERDLLKYASNYLFQRKNPDKTIQLLDSVLSYVKVFSSKFHPYESVSDLIRKKEHFLADEKYSLAKQTLEKIDQIRSHENETAFQITKKDIIKMVERKTGCEILQYTKLLRQLEKKLFTTIVGQDKALKMILNGLSNSSLKPISFLLYGPSGVGKTQTVKLISKGLKTKLIHIDMNEYMTPDSIYRLIGDGRKDVSYVFQFIQENPYATVLIDEIEKASPKVMQLFLQILENGIIHDCFGNELNFSLAQIFFTSTISKSSSIGFDKQSSPSIDVSFSKEFIGRIAYTVPYEKIDEETALKYIESCQGKLEDAHAILKQTNLDKYGLREIHKILQKSKKTHLDNFKVSC